MTRIYKVGGYGTPKLLWAEAKATKAQYSIARDAPKSEGWYTQRVEKMAYAHAPSGVSLTRSVPAHLERQAERHFYSLAEKIGIKIAIRTKGDEIWVCRLPESARSQGTDAP